MYHHRITVCAHKASKYSILMSDEWDGKAGCGRGWIGDCFDMDIQRDGHITSMNHTNHKVLFQIFITEMAGRFPDITFFFYRKMAIHSTFDRNLLIFFF